MGSLIPGSRKQKYLSDEEINKIASAYQNYRKKKGKYQDVEGFCKLATIEEIQNHGYNSLLVFMWEQKLPKKMILPLRKK